MHKAFGYLQKQKPFLSSHQNQYRQRNHQTILLNQNNSILGIRDRAILSVYYGCVSRRGANLFKFDEKKYLVSWQRLQRKICTNDRSSKRRFGKLHLSIKGTDTEF
jgi:hypothetical protein